MVAPENKRTTAPTEPIGSSGLVQFGGYVQEERAPQGERDWIAAYTRMKDQSPIVGALLAAFDTLIRGVEWSMEPADDSPEAADLAAFVDGCIEDMAQTWEDVLAEIGTMFPYGWALLETVYKRRKGLNTKEPLQSSRYDDGAIGWASWSLRSQETLQRWEFDPHGAILGMWQVAAPLYQTVYLPIEKCLLFRTTAQRGNPLGRSILRNAWRSFSFMEKIERLEGIGIERDLAGLPVIELPASIMEKAIAGDSVASTVYTNAQKVVQNLRRDTLEGVVLPVAYDEHGNKLYDLKLLSTGGSRQFDTDKTIQRYGRQIAMSVLADFVYIGHESTGSYALIEEKTKLFTRGLEGYLDNIAAVVNLDAIPRLARLNGRDPALSPRLTHGRAGNVNLKDLAAYLAAVSGAGLIDPTDDGIRRYVRAAADLPEPPETDDPEGDTAPTDDDVDEGV